MLLPLFQALESTAIGEALRTSLWLFPVIEAFHLMGLAVAGGAVLLVDMRLLGLALRGAPMGPLARDAQDWLIGSLVVLIGSGIPLFLSESIKCYYSFAFWTKMTALVLAIMFTFTIRRKVTMATEGTHGPATSRAVGIISIALWALVGWGGRWIGFS